MECELLDESDEKETSYVTSVSNSKDSKKDQQLNFLECQQILVYFYYYYFLQD